MRAYRIEINIPAEHKRDLPERLHAVAVKQGGGSGLFDAGSKPTYIVDRPRLVIDVNDGNKGRLRVRL